jgi:hypothetical protein
MTAMLKMEEAIARWSACGAKDAGEKSCSTISLKGRQAGQCLRKNSKESKRVSRKSFDEFRWLRAFRAATCGAACGWPIEFMQEPSGSIPGPKYHPNAPFGGYKMSGYSRENRVEALESYTQYKSIWANLGAN